MGQGACGKRIGRDVVTHAERSGVRRDTGNTLMAASLCSHSLNHSIADSLTHLDAHTPGCATPHAGGCWQRLLHWQQAHLCRVGVLLCTALRRCACACAAHAQRLALYTWRFLLVTCLISSRPTPQPRLGASRSSSHTNSTCLTAPHSIRSFLTYKNLSGFASGGGAIRCGEPLARAGLCCCLQSPQPVHSAWVGWDPANAAPLCSPASPEANRNLKPKPLPTQVPWTVCPRTCWTPTLCSRCDLFTRFLGVLVQRLVTPARSICTPRICLPPDIAPCRIIQAFHDLLPRPCHLASPSWCFAFWP